MDKQNIEKRADIFDDVTSSLKINPTVLESAQNRYDAAIVVNKEPINWLANVIANAIYDARYTKLEPKSFALYTDGRTENDIAELFIAAAKVAIGARVYQVSNRRTGFNKKQFEYIALLGPILGSYGVYHDATLAYDIVPKLSVELEKELKEMGCFSESGAFIVPAWYPDVMAYFRRFHLMTGYGLPRDQIISDPSIFELTVESERVIGTTTAMSVKNVIIATLVSSSKLTDLFGSYRVLYTGLQTVRTSIENIGLKALHDLTS